MQMSEFITTNMDPILREWDTFARSVSPAAEGVSAARLRDHAREMLLEIAADMQTAQSSAEQQAKSEGHGRNRGPSDSPAQKHALARIADSFTLNEVVGEIRALRASVIRLWTREKMGPADREKIDELIRFNESIDQALSESVARYLAGIDRARDLLLGALAHDLRNPLGAIVQSAHFLLRDDTLESADTKAAVRILNSGTRMKGMISDLLDFTRTRLGDQLPITLRPMDMREAFGSIAEEVTSAHPDRQLQFRSEGALTGNWDPDRIAQMLSNLIGNAVQHGDPDSPIQISASGTESVVRIEIHNKGAPIPESLRASLFDPLSRGAAQERISTITGSIGLGLYIARQIAKAHAGTVLLAASDHDGTTFAVELPRRNAPLQG
jgi:signal transduction histidine kinase